jgi:hypothetical protein
MESQLDEPHACPADRRSPTGSSRSAFAQREEPAIAGPRSQAPSRAAACILRRHIESPPTLKREIWTGDWCFTRILRSFTSRSFIRIRISFAKRRTRLCPRQFEPPVLDMSREGEIHNRISISDVHIIGSHTIHDRIICRDCRLSHCSLIVHLSSTVNWGSGNCKMAPLAHPVLGINLFCSRETIFVSHRQTGFCATVNFYANYSALVKLAI